MGSEFPVQSTPDVVCLSFYTSQEKKTVPSFDPDCQASFSCLPLFVPPPFRLSLFSLLDAPKPPAEDHFIMPDEFGTPAVEGPRRAKRSPINSNRVGGLNVETLVVADRRMLEKHGRDNVTTYVLTVMNMVRWGWEEEERRPHLTYEIIIAQRLVEKLFYCSVSTSFGSFI